MPLPRPLYGAGLDKAAIGALIKRPLVDKVAIGAAALNKIATGAGPWPAVDKLLARRSSGLDLREPDLRVGPSGRCLEIGLPLIK